MSSNDQRLPSAHVGELPAWARPRDDRGRLASDPRAQPGSATSKGTGMEVAGGDREWVPKVELPRGGGAIRPVGEKVEAQAFNGSASYSIALAVSPGRDGRGPALSLGYSSGGGNGPFGLGWSLSVPSITRKTDKRLPTYEDVRESDVFVLAGAEDLVPLHDDAGQRVVRARMGFNVYPYRPRVAGAFARIERWVDSSSGEMHWRVQSPDGVTAWYGQTAQARVADPEDPRRVFSWLLERTEDDRGHITLYEYKAEEPQTPTARVVAERNRSPSAGRYLERVRYGNAQPGVAEGFLFEVVFDYGEYGHEDGGEVFVTPVPEREWSLREDSQRGEVLVYKRPRGDGRYAPAVPLGQQTSTAKLGDDGQLVDLDADGQLELVTARGYYARTGSGGWTGLRSFRTVPTSIPEGPHVHRVDLDGDGLPELLVFRSDGLRLRRQLEHIIRAASTIAEDDEIIIVGSQAILGTYPMHLQRCSSDEADVYPKNLPERAAAGPAR
jgi:Salmonella virulence plasmid 65kDa B protein